MRAAALVLLAGCAEPRPPVGEAPACIDRTIDHPAADLLQDLLDDTVADGLPGLVLVVDDPQGYWAGAAGFADLPHGVALDPCHLVRIASVTKTFTAVVAMRLAERGEIDLDDDVAAHLDPRDAEKVDGAAAATWRTLLHHTAGVPDYPRSTSFSLDTFQRPTAIRSRERLIRYAWPMKAPDGWAYSNTGYELVGEALEDVTGEPLATLMEDEVFAPAGLERAWFADLDDVPEPTARAYSDVLFRGGALTDVTEWDRSGERAATDVITSAVDLHRFGRALFDGGLVTEASFAEMTDWVDAGDEEAGLGLFRTEFEDTTWVGHTGGIPGFSTRLGRIEEQDAVVVFVATGGGLLASEVLEDFEDAIAATLVAP